MHAVVLFISLFSAALALQFSVLITDTNTSSGICAVWLKSDGQY